MQTFTGTADAMKEQIKEMDKEEREDLAERLHQKAIKILQGELGDDERAGENFLWAGDLLRAAGLIQRYELTLEDADDGGFIPDCCRFEALSESEGEEIESVLGD